jgi:arsenate reductase (thioredoxin)
MKVVSTQEPLKVLFLCTGNSARSQMAEVILNRLGAGKFRAFSAGSQPAGYVHPMAVQMLRNAHYDTSKLRSKSWEEFAGPDAPPLDFVFTVCDNAAKEVCPIWPGQPMTAHWRVPDPAKVKGTEPSKTSRLPTRYGCSPTASASSSACPSTNSANCHCRRSSRRSGNRRTRHLKRPPSKPCLSPAELWPRPWARPCS